MASVDVTGAVSLYRDLVNYASTSSVNVAAPDTAGGVHIRAVHTQRDLERSDKVKFSRSYFVKVDGGQCNVLFESPPEELNNE